MPPINIIASLAVKALSTYPLVAIAVLLEVELGVGAVGEPVKLGLFVFALLPQPFTVIFVPAIFT